MASINVRKVTFYLFAALLTVFAAAFLGSKVGDAVNQRKLKKFEATRQKVNESILSKMENVEAGNRIADCYFEDLNRNSLRLSDVIAGRTAIIFMEPDCPACIQEIEEIRRVIKDFSEYRHFVFVSSVNPLHLIDLRDEYNIPSPILYDHKDVFSSRFKVYTYPFNMIVNERLEVEEVIPGRLSEGKIKEIMDSNSE
jgi:peroxiredoxin